MSAQPSAEPFLAGSRLLELLGELESAAPVVLVVDDLHWADQPSVRALVFALRRLVADQVLVLLAVRDDAVAALPESLRRIVSGHHGAVVRVPGLDEHELRELATALGVASLPSRAARRLRAGTHGNPLHVRAVLDESPPGLWADEGKPLPSPRSFRLLVGDRYAACRAETRDLLDAAAVLGVRAGLPLAAARRRGRPSRCRRSTRPRGAVSWSRTRASPLDAGVPPPAGPLGPARRARSGPAHDARTSPPPGSSTTRSRCCTIGPRPPPRSTPRSPTTSRTSPTVRRRGRSGRARRDTSWRPVGCARTARRAAGGCSSR